MTPMSVERMATIKVEQCVACSTIDRKCADDFFVNRAIEKENCSNGE